MKLIAQIHPRIPVIVLERHHAGRRLPLVPKYLSWRPVEELRRRGVCRLSIGKSESVGKRSDCRANRTIRDESGAQAIRHHLRRAGRAGRSKRWRSRRRRGQLGRRADRSNQVAAIVASPAQLLLPRRSRRVIRLKSPVTTRRCPSTKCGQNPRLCVPGVSSPPASSTISGTQ
jgi:hypothetical protein